jgi:PAS domain S-box-containing protein
MVKKKKSAIAQNPTSPMKGAFQHTLRFFAPPIFPGEDEKTRQAALLNTLLVSAMLLLVFIALILVPLVFSQKVLNGLIIAAQLGLMMLAYGFLRRGYVRLAGYIFVVVFWLVFTALLPFSGGLSSTTIVFYIVETVIAGFLFGLRGAIIQAAACGVTGLILAILQLSDRLPPRVFPIVPWVSWLDLVMALFMTVTITHLAFHSLRDALVLTKRRLEEKQQAENELRESETRFSVLSAAAFEGIAITIEDKIVDSNTQLASMLGYEAKEMVGLDSMTLVAPESRPLVETNAQQEIDSPYEHLAIKKDGTIFPVEVRAKTISYKGQRARVAIIRDISDQKKAEEAVRKSERHFRALIENSSDITLLADQNWIAIYVSPSFERITGHKLDQQLGKSVVEFVHPDDRQLTLRLLDHTTAIPDQPASPPLRIRFADGSWHWVEGVAHDMFDDPDVRAMVINLRDITERKQAEEALRVSEEKFRRLFETSRDFLYVTSMDGRILEVNKAASTLSGYSQEELKNTYIQEMYFNPKERDALIARITEHGFAQNYEIRGRRKDGIVVDTLVNSTAIKDEQGKVIGFQGSIKDISELKRAQEALAKSEKRFRALIENATDAITLIDSTGTVLYTSPSNRIVTGYTTDQRIGKKFYDVIHPDDKDKAILRIEEAAKKTGIVNIPPIRALHGDGTWHWVEGVVQNLVREPSVGAIVVNFRDITERKQAEEAIARQVQRLRALHSIEQAITCSTELPTILDLLAKTVVEHLHMDAISLLLINESSLTLDYAAGRGFHTDALKYTNLAIGTGLAGDAAKRQKIVHIHNLIKLQNNPTLLHSILQEKFVTYFGVPLVAKGRLCGVMEIFHRSEFFPDADWMSFLETLGGQAALAIDNAHLLEVTQLQLKETEALYRINQGLTSSTDPLQLMDEVVSLLQKNFGYHYVQIFIREPVNGNFVVKAGSGGIGKKLVEQGYCLAAGEGIVGYTAETGAAFFTNDVDSVIAFQRNPLLPDSKSELAVPIKIGEQFLGLLDVHQAPPAALSQRDLQLVSAAADQLAVALQKAQLFTDLQYSLRQEKETRAQLIHSEKLAVAGRLLASVSHELNNPLQAIHNALYLLKEETGFSLQGQQDLNIVLSEAERMSAMLDRLRTTYQPVRAEEFQPVQVNEIIGDVQMLVATHLRHANIAYKSHPDPKLPPVPGLTDQLRQVILNLFMNAVDAMPDGGSLSVSTAFLEETCEIQVDIADTGPGIDQTILSHIFEPFVSNKEKGTGLGLAISYEIIFNHNGRITAENLPNGGALFRFWLPAANGGLK